LAFGINVVFEEVAEITSAFNAVSVSPTVIATGPLLAPAHAVEIFGGVEIVGALFTVVVSVGVVVVVLEFPVNVQ
jgi:hypothetical protein